jgi:hypothetical protein
MGSGTELLFLAGVLGSGRNVFGNGSGRNRFGCSTPFLTMRCGVKVSCLGGGPGVFGRGRNVCGNGRGRKRREGLGFCATPGQTICCTTTSIVGLAAGLSAKYSITCFQSVSDMAGVPEGRAGRSPLMTFNKAEPSDSSENGDRPVYNYANLVGQRKK